MRILIALIGFAVPLMSIAHADTSKPGMCGGIAGLACGAGQFCDYPMHARCGAADQTGVCRKTPEFCTADYDPVCGCDGKTYGNACTAASQRISVAAQGRCGGEAK